MIDKEKINFTSDEKRAIRERLTAYSASLSVFASRDEDAVYNSAGSGSGNFGGGFFDYRTNYGRDIDNILNNIFYSRFGDKTQVHSFYKNDDLTRRALHVQLVSRIARSIGIVLNLNLELIEAIALGHDIGHTPFGHRGESYLSDLYQHSTGKFFHHNVHSIRVLKDIAKTSTRGLSLQVLDGILCHNGEFLLDKLTPSDTASFSAFEEKYQKGYTARDDLKTYKANTLEGCLVRLCDVLAYVGKDRQDLIKVGEPAKFEELTDHGIGKKNNEILSSVIPNLIKNSLNKPYIMLDPEIAQALEKAKQDNYDIIYNSTLVTQKYTALQTLFARIFECVLRDLKNKTDHSFVYKNFLNMSYFSAYRKDIDEQKHLDADVAVDYIASMTDDYFIDLCKQLDYKEVDSVTYTGYFEG